MSLARKMKRAAVKPPMSGLSVDVGRRLQLKSKPVNRKDLDLHDKICGISACVGGGTIRLEDLQHFIGCGFDEAKYEKLFGKERVATPELEDQLKCALAVALPSGLREELVSAANDDGLTLNQYVVKVLKDSVKEE